MNLSIILGLLQNIAVLITFALLYDYIWIKDQVKQTIFNKILTGIITGGIGILLMLTPWTLIPGLVFDTRSIMLAIAGIFFGPIPTLIAIIMMGLYRISLGGDGMIMGISVIVSSGIIGIIWRYSLQKSKRDYKILDLYLLGVVVHIVMLLCILFLPSYLQLSTFKNIIIPVIILYPIGTAFLGLLLVHRIKNWDTKRALKESEERFKMLFEKAPIGYQSLDENGRIKEVNQTWLDILGYDKKDVLGKWFGDFLAPEFVEAFRARFPLFKSLGKIHSEFEMVKKDGTNFTAAFEGRIGYTISNEFKQTHCVLSDITEQIRAEQALKESEERYRSLFENANDAILIMDNEIFIECNGKAIVTFGGTDKNDILNHQPWELSPMNQPDGSLSIEKAKYWIRLAYEGNSQRFEWVHKKIDGTLFAADISLSFINVYNKGFVQAIVRDISEQKKILNALSESEEKYKLLYENAGVGIGYFSLEGIIMSLNGLALKFYDGKPDDYIGKSLYEIHPKGKADFYMERITQTANSENSLEFEDYVILPTGNKWFLSVYTKVKNIQNDVIGVQIISQDISSMKEIEISLKKKNDELQRFNDLTIGREIKMIELKKEINHLLTQMGENEKYKISK